MLGNKGLSGRLGLLVYFFTALCITVWNVYCICGSYGGCSGPTFPAPLLRGKHRSAYGIIPTSIYGRRTSLKRGASNVCVSFYVYMHAWCMYDVACVFGCICMHVCMYRSSISCMHVCIHVFMLLPNGISLTGKKKQQKDYCCDKQIKPIVSQLESLFFFLGDINSFNVFRLSTMPESFPYI